MQFPKQLNELFSPPIPPVRQLLKLILKKKKGQWKLQDFLPWLNSPVWFIPSACNFLNFFYRQPKFCIIYQYAVIHLDDEIPKIALNVLKNTEIHNINIVHLKLAKQKDSQCDLKRARKAFKPKTNSQHSTWTRRSFYHTFKMEKHFRVQYLILCIKNPFHRICQSNWTAYLPCSLVQRSVRTKISHTIICQQMCLDQ